MSDVNDYIAEAVAAKEGEIQPEQFADLWILLSAYSGALHETQNAGEVLAALAGPDIAVRALMHMAHPTNGGLSDASGTFLRNLMAHSSPQDVAALVKHLPEATSTRAPRSDSEPLVEVLRSVLSEREPGRLEMETRSWRMDVMIRLLIGWLSDDDRLTAAAELASLHSDLEPTEPAGICSLLSTVARQDDISRELAGEPRITLTADDVSDALLRQTRIEGEAMASIWRYPMLEPSAAAVALGAKPANRERVRTLRERSWLLGLPRGRAYLYPQFQFDPVSRDIFSSVQTVNELLDAAHDPWGVASWWIERNDQIDARPIDLVGSDSEALEHAARSLVEPVG